jgi:hypothetical protein
LSSLFEKLGCVIQWRAFQRLAISQHLEGLPVATDHQRKPLHKHFQELGNWPVERVDAEPLLAELDIGLDFVLIQFLVAE